jgi:tetratricopeptide (TPR) repeat protein
VVLGLRLELAGDVRGAIEAYSRAVDAGEEPQHPRTILRCAERLEGRGLQDAAERMFRRVQDAAEPSLRAQAWRGVASYLMGRGQMTDAVAAFRMIIDTGDPDETPRAYRNLGTVLEDHFGDLAGALFAYESAVRCEHPQYSPGARVNLAQLVDRQGDYANAERLFREAIASGHPIEAQRARVLLGMMVEERGNVGSALQWYLSAIGDEGFEWTQRAAFCAGSIYLMQLGDFRRAADLFRIAEQVDDPTEATRASFLRADAERQSGNQEAALASYLRVVNADVLGEARFAAAKQAGAILLRRYDYAGARNLLVLAAQANDPEERARGWCLLGMCERALGNRDEATTAFRHATAQGAPQDIRRMAAQALAELGVGDASATP